MNAHALKEAKILVHFWGIATAVAFLPFLVLPGWWQVEQSAVVLVLASFGLSSLPWGHELACGTLNQWFSQPMPRKEMWWAKQRFLGASLGIWLIYLIWADSRIPAKDFDNVLWFLPVLAWATVPLFTLWSRTAIAGVIFAIFIPCFWLILVNWLGGELAHRAYHWLSPPELRAIKLFSFLGGLAALTVISLKLSFRQIFSMELVDSSPGQSNLPLSFPWISTRAERCGAGTRHSSLWPLLAKEFRLQQMPMIFAAGVSVLALLIAILGQMRVLSYPELWFALPFYTYTPILPILIGTLAMGEEKGLGVHAWHLTFPRSAFAQWAIKTGVALLTNLLLGVLLPWALLLMVQRFGNFPPLMINPEIAVYLLASQSLLFASAYYSGSISPNTLRGIVWSGALLASLAFLFLGIVRGVQAVNELKLEVFVGMPILLEQLGPRASAAVGLVLLVFSYFNFQTVDLPLRRLVLQLTIVLGPLAVILLLLLGLSFVLS